jgi:biopolymer transport protein ExbD
MTDHDSPQSADESAEALLRRPIEAAEMDMTPMVDMVFLLLIFFMITAAFSLQKSLEVPTPDQDKESSQAQTQTLDTYEENDDYVIVRIDDEDTIWVNDSEAPSEQELLIKLREARSPLPGSDSAAPTSMLVLAAEECHHATVVMVLDAGNAVGMENVRLATGDGT